MDKYDRLSELMPDILRNYRIELLEEIFPTPTTSLLAVYLREFELDKDEFYLAVVAEGMAALGMHQLDAIANELTKLRPEDAEEQPVE